MHDALSIARNALATIKNESTDPSARDVAQRALDRLRGKHVIEVDVSVSPYTQEEWMERLRAIERI